jgi:threonine dehydratase
VSGLSLQHVYQARRRLAGRIIRTPLIRAADLSARLGTEVYLKLESLQTTGSFKVRGALNKILCLSDEERKRGVITFSTGNHGRAVAYAAARTKTKATVCVSTRVPAYRVKAIHALGAETVIHGRSQDEAEKRYHQLKQERRLCEIKPFDDPLIIAGQGTVGVEIAEELPGLDTVLIPLSGGGLVSGIALALKALSPQVRVVAVSCRRSPAMLESVKASRPVAIEEQDTLADSLLGGIGRENRYTLGLVSRLVDEHFVVGEEEIARGMAYALKYHSLVVEGAGAVGIGALLSGKLSPPTGNLVVLVSGSSVELPRYLETVSAFIRRNTRS